MIKELAMAPSSHPLKKALDPLMTLALKVAHKSERRDDLLAEEYKEQAGHLATAYLKVRNSKTPEEAIKWMYWLRSAVGTRPELVEIDKVITILKGMSDGGH